MNREEALASIESGNGDMVLALLALGREGDGLDVKALMPLLNSDEMDIKVIASGTISTIIRRSLIEHYNQHSEESRQKLGTLLSKVDPSIVLDVVDKLNSKNEDLLIESIRLLKYIDVNRDKKALMTALLANGDNRIRATAVRLLTGEMKQGESQIIADLISDPDSRVRANTTEVIEELNDIRLLHLLYRLKNDPNNRVRANALKALYGMGKGRAVEGIHTMLATNDPLMQASALWVISKLKCNDRISRTYCKQFVNSSDDMVKRQARSALQAIEMKKIAEQ